MKTIILSVILLLTASMASAGSDVQYRLSSYGHNLILNTASWNNLDLTVSIQDEQDHVLMTKTYKSSKAFKACKFDLSALNRGQYKIYITDTEKSYKQKFTILRQEIFISPEVETYMKPTFKLNEKQLHVNFMTFGLTSTVKILNSTNETIYETETAEQSFDKILNLTKLGRGSFTVVVTVGNDQYWHSFDLN
jgi:hypothetical protein